MCFKGTTEPAFDELVQSIHVGQLEEVAPVGEDAVSELLCPYEVAGH